MFSVLPNSTTALGLSTSTTLKVANEIFDLLGILNCGINFALYTVTPVMRRNINKRVKEGVRARMRDVG